MLILLLSLACTVYSPKDSSSTDSSTTNSSTIVGNATSGEVLFSNCAGCHGADGTGGIDIGGTPSADLIVKVPSKTDAELEDIIKNGFGTAMPGQYSEAQDVADVIAYLRVNFP